MTIKNLLLLAFLLGAYFGFGQFGELNFITDCIVCTVEDVKVVDLDNDGEKDVISASSFDNKVA